MKTSSLISINDFCKYHQIDVSFIKTLNVSGLIEIVMVKGNGFINTTQLQKLEKLVLFYYELDINLEGIESISHLLNRILNMQNEIRVLKNRLHFYESND